MNDDDKFPGRHPEACIATGLDLSQDPIDLDNLSGLVPISPRNLTRALGHARARRLAQNILKWVDADDIGSVIQSEIEDGTAGHVVTIHDATVSVHRDEAE